MCGGWDSIYVLILRPGAEPQISNVLPVEYDFGRMSKLAGVADFF